MFRWIKNPSHQNQRNPHTNYLLWKLGWAKNVQKSWYTKTTLRHTWWDLKGSQKVIRWLSWPILPRAEQPNARGGPDASGSPMGVTFWPENENLCGNPTFWAILILWKKFWSHMIFLTLFSKNCPFLDKFDKNLFLLQWPTHMNKRSHKFNTKLIFGHL